MGAHVELDEDVPGGRRGRGFEGGKLGGVVDQEEDLERLAELGELREDGWVDGKTVDALGVLDVDLVGLDADLLRLGFPLLPEVDSP